MSEKKEDLFQGNDFFKSHELDPRGTGQLLQKSIPTIPRQVPTIQEAPSLYAPKEVPASVKAFKKEVEGLFKNLDKIVSDMKEDLSEWDSSYFCESYYSFKKSFQQKINNIIMYPMSPETKARIKKEAEGKINIL